MTCISLQIKELPSAAHVGAFTTKAIPKNTSDMRVNKSSVSFYYHQI